MDGHKHTGRLQSLSSFSGNLNCSYTTVRHKYLVPIVSLQLEEVCVKITNLAIASYIHKKDNTMIYYFKYDINSNVFERNSA